MSSIVSLDTGRDLRARGTSTPRTIAVALLGCGNVGGAFAALTRQPRRALDVRITTAFVRNARRDRPALRGDTLRTCSADVVFASAPHVVVELLGGTEPARTLVLESLERGIPVVTANKSLLARHGRELREAADATATPLLYEAAVIAGVPFLGTFARRPHAADITTLEGIANGTSNYLLTRAAADRTGIGAALDDARRLGLAEPDPSNDIEGIDAAEKLAVLLQHFADAAIAPAEIETQGIGALTAGDIELAAALDGTIKPVITADWRGGLSAFAGPAFVPHGHLLAAVDGAENILVLGGPRGRIVLRGPGAGPDVTAATVLDDVLEAAGGVIAPAHPALHDTACHAPETEWFIALTGERVPRGLDIADLLASYGVYIRRTGPRRSADGVERVAALTWPCERPRLERALQALAYAAGCRTSHIRALGA